MLYKFFVTSDIHGHYQEFTKMLSKAGFSEENPKHVLVICGDMFDRGKDNTKIYLYIKELIDKYGDENVIVLKGNHELFFEDLDNNDQHRVFFNYQYNRFDMTISDFTKLDLMEIRNYSNAQIKDLINHNYPGFLDWIKSLPYYYETKNYLFTHAGFNPEIPLDQTNWHNAVWTKSETLEFLDLTKYGITKKLVMGHRPTILLGEYEYDIHYSPDTQKIYIDGGCAYGGKLNVLVIEDEKIRSSIS
ncbi:MAG: metallophosphoesterase [Bacilli bacterium]|nr:metallophosphoesterase [Bacilli bacterium]